MELKKVIENIDGDYHHEDEQGTWQGECFGYRSNGNMLYKTYFKDHKEHGICAFYNENGEINYKKYYWNDEEISRKEYFQNVFKELEKC